MSYLITYILSLAIAISSFFSVPFNDLESAFEKGNADKIMSYSKEKVLISIDNKEGVYSKSQGTQVLKSFFDDYPPSAFTFDFKGKESGSNSYAVGKYTSLKDHFRVSVKFQKESEDYLIESITIIKKK